MKIVLEGLLGITGLTMFVILTIWLVYFIRAMRKSFKTWKAHPSNSYDEERGYVVRMELAKLVLIVFFLITAIILLTIFGVQNSNRLSKIDKHEDKMDHDEDKCKIEPTSWIWDKVHGNKYTNWFKHGQWQPFALITMIAFELVLMQILTSQYHHSKRIFTWQVKVTFILGILEAAGIFLLNAFAESILFGHILFIFLLQLHLILIEFCLFKLYRVMKKQIAELKHLNSKEYSAILTSKRHYQCFIIPQIIIIHACVIVEFLYVIIITVETIVVNNCWIEETYKLQYSMRIGKVGDLSVYTHCRYAISLMRITLMFTLIVYNLIFNGIYCFKEWKSKRENKTSNECTMQNSDEIQRPLISTNSSNGE